MNEKIMTDIYKNNKWGCKSSVSGPSSTLEKTSQLRLNLPTFFKNYTIQSILDCGCGDFTWMKDVNLTEIQYLGVDIVEPLITKNQSLYTNKSRHFQKMDLLEDPPEQADLWIARDFFCICTFLQIKQFFMKFLESESNYLAISSIETESPNKDGLFGDWRKINLLTPPFSLQYPTIRIEDGIQWFCQKYLHVYTRNQIQNCSFLNYVEQKNEVSFSGDVSNISLRDIKLDTNTMFQSRTLESNASLPSNILLKNITMNTKMGFQSNPIESNTMLPSNIPLHKIELNLHKTNSKK
jgi:hypothetical protein